MKKLRIISVLVCILLLISLFSPVAYATSVETSDLNNVIYSSNFALYTFKNYDQTYNIHLDITTGNGSFAIIYNSKPDYMYETLFAVPPESINISSIDFWNLLISACFSRASEWTTIYLPSTILTQKAAPSSTILLSEDTAKAYFQDWLYENYGATYTDRFVSRIIMQSYVFEKYESLDYEVLFDQSYYISTAISIAGFITSVLGMIVSPGYLSALGLLFSAGSLIPAGTTLHEYCLGVYMQKYIKLLGGSIKHANATKQIYYTAFAKDEENYYSIVSTPKIGYNPSETLFEDEEALQNAAWEHFCNP